jgi:translocation and assembly module TamB
MSRRSRILVTIVSVIGGLVIAIIIAALIVIQTSWFKNYVREKIIALTEESTGGKVELGSFSFNWRSERVEIRNFIIHGTEPAGSPPLLKIDSIALQLKLLSSFKKMVDLEYLGVTRPSVNVMVFENGKTNIPQPKVVKKSSGKSGLQTVVDLAVHKFELTGGTVRFSQQSIPLNVRGENLLAELNYNASTPSYEGRLTMDPIYAVSGQRAPLVAHLELPVRIEGDAVRLSNGKLTTANSSIAVSGSLEHLAAPVVAAQLHAHIALPEIQAMSGASIYPNAQGAPNSVDADAAINMDDQRIEIKSARLSLGNSRFSASGLLRDRARPASAQFTGNLDLDQIGKLLNVSAAPQGTVEIAGNASLPQEPGYLVTGTINGRDMTARNGTARLGPVNLRSDFKIDPKAADLTNLLVRAFGGELAGSAQLANMQYLKLQAQLHGFKIGTLARAMQPRPLTYDGTLSGSLTANADLKAKGTAGINAQTQLTITPGNQPKNQGTPISGRLFAKYSGANETVAFGNSYIEFPNSRLNLSGVLGNQASVRFLSRDLNDLSPALNFVSAKSAQPLPLALRKGGSASLNATASGPLKSAHILGHAAVTQFTASGRNFDRLLAYLTASPGGAHIDNGLLQRGTLQAKFAGGIGLRDWTSSPRSPVAVNANIQNAGLADILALAGKGNAPVTGQLSAHARIGGTLGNPSGGASVSIGNGSAYGEPFDRADAKVTFADRLVTLQPAEIVAGPASLSASGTFTHPRDSISSGHLQMQVSTSDISLAQFKTLQNQHPGLAGIVKLNANAAADLLAPKGGSSQLALRTVNGDLSAQSIRDAQQKYGDLTASVKTAGTDVTYLVNSDFAGSTTAVHGLTHLTADYPTTLDASIKSLQVEKALQLAGKPEVPVRGNLSADAHLNGTMKAPHADLSLDFVNASAYGEPINELNGKLAYTAQNVNIPALQMSTPAGNISLSGNLSHPANNFDRGHLVLHLDTDEIQLAKVHTLQKAKPGLGGSLKVGTDLDATLNRREKNSPIQFSKLNANIKAGALRFNNQDFGDVSAQAKTQGAGISVAIDSDLAKSSIHGQGLVLLTKGYPVNAKLSFANIQYVNFAPLLASVATSTPRPSFNGLVAGQVTVNGPVAQVDQLKASVSLRQLQLSTASPRASEGPGSPIILLQNQEPIVADLNRSIITVRSAHLTGRSTDISASGTASLLKDRPLDLKVNATTNLGLLQQLNRDIYSEGTVAANATIRGTAAQPIVNGKVELKKASVNMTSSPNGLSNANGVILLTGTTASIQTLTAETGGGKIALRGFASLTGSTIRFAMRATATKVRTRYSGASVTSDAAITLTGTTDRSLLSGTVTVDRVAFNTQSDVGSLLSSTATPPQTPEAPSGFLSAMRLDIRVRTSPALSVQTSVTQNLQADADLSVRGTVLSPGIVGRMTITSGQFVFFGNKYTVNRGVISFFNPTKIQPVLDVNLETTVKGVDVILGVTGPVDDMKLSYRSDPPLRFDEIVGLLATGKVPSSDPTIAAHQPATPDQSLTQMGESAIVSQAVAAPLASRIQRVFGVNQLKIDPTFVSGSSLPQARVTLQQQISPTIVFTYTTDLTQTTSQIIRLEWAFTPRFSAVATRDEYGIVSLDFFVKRQFR